MATPLMFTDCTARAGRVTIIPRFRPEPVKPTNPTKFLPTSTLLECMLVKKVEENPYKKSGPGLPVAIWEVEGEGFVRVRVDMPGANTVRVYPDPNENSINFKGVEEEITMHGISKEGGVCRTYEGSLYLGYDRFGGPGFDDFGYEFCNGVLSFKIQCHKPATSEDLGVQLMTHNQEMKESAINPLVSKGKDRFTLHDVINDFNRSVVLAIDMPGIGEEDHLVIHVSQTGTINFSAEEKHPKLIEPKRIYEGVFKVEDSEEFDLNKAQFEINHGVFWARVPEVVVTSDAPSVTIFDGDDCPRYLRAA